MRSAGSSKASLLGLEMAVFSHVLTCSPSVPVSSYEDTSHVGSGPSYLFISPNNLFKEPLSTYSPSGGSRGWDLDAGIYGGRDSA